MRSLTLLLVLLLVLAVLCAFRAFPGDFRLIQTWQWMRICANRIHRKAAARGKAQCMFRPHIVHAQKQKAKRSKAAKGIYKQPASANRVEQSEKAKQSRADPHLTKPNAEQATMSEVISVTPEVDRPQTIEEAYARPDNFLEIDVSDPKTETEGSKKYTTYEVNLRVSHSLSINVSFSLHFFLLFSQSHNNECSASHMLLFVFLCVCVSFVRLAFLCLSFLCLVLLGPANPADESARFQSKRVQRAPSIQRL